MRSFLSQEGNLIYLILQANEDNLKKIALD